MNFFSRRDFLQGTAGLAASLAGASMFEEAAEASQAQQPGNANERLNVAVIGVNGRGRDHVNGFAGKHNCHVTHICDVDTSVAGRAVAAAEKAQGVRPTVVQDLRRIMDNKNIHLVSIATPNHWHSLAGIWAMQAGKHVYVEKPVSHNVFEGRRLVEISRSTGKLCQAGTQIRSSSGCRAAIEFLRSGKLGELKVARGLCYKRRTTIGRAQGETAIPKTVDYDLWCGPAPRRPLTRLRLHYDWHWIWDYGNGDLGNQGIHQMDVARWGLNKNEMPRSVVSLGGRFGYTDDGQTANTQIAVMDYGTAKLIFEVRGLQTRDYRGASVGNVFECTEGYLVFPNYTSAIAYDLKGTELRRFTGGGDHYANFVAAVRANRRQDLKGEVEEGHLSSALCHLANISYRLGRATQFNGQNAAFGEDRDANETFTRMRDHLSDANNAVPLDRTSYMMGRRLNIDIKTERFVNDDEANRFLTREYRKGFEVPARA